MLFKYVLMDKSQNFHICWACSYLEFHRLMYLDGSFLVRNEKAVVMMQRTILQICASIAFEDDPWQTMTCLSKG